MALVRLRRAAQITLPLELREALGLEEGDYLEAQLTEAGILLSPVNINRRGPTPEQEADMLGVVNEERRAYAAERRY